MSLEVGLEPAPQALLHQRVGKRLHAGRLPLPHPLVGELAAVAVVLLLAALLRLSLAAHGWPSITSDEAVIGLMADDIIGHGAHPVFFYGQHYMGAFQAYLAIPFFKLLGSTSLALHATTTLQYLLFLLALYAFTRVVYSVPVAWLAVTLLALQPGESLIAGLRAGVGAQDTLLFGALLLWLTVLRLRHPRRGAKKLLLDGGIGLAAGMGLWADALIAPFVLAAGLALGVEALRKLRGADDRARLRRRLAGEILVIAGAAGVALAPALWVTITSQGAIFREFAAIIGTPGVADAPDPVHRNLWVVLASQGKQVAATLLVGMPRLFGSRQVCPTCVVWPSPGVSATLGQVLQLALVALPYSLGAISCWALTAWPLIKDTRAAFRRRRKGIAQQVARPQTAEVASFDARWWGRAMLALGGGLTTLAYVAGNPSYNNPVTSTRYLVGLFLCVPLVAEPLWKGVWQCWRWLRGQKGHVAVPPRLRAAAMLAVIATLALLIINSAGALSAVQQSANGRSFAVPASARDAQVLAFLKRHGATRFYTTYGVCYRLMFESDEQVACGFLEGTDISQTSFGRTPQYQPLIAQSAHPAYVFDTTTHEGQPQQVEGALARGDPRLAGYTKAVIAGYIIYYYAAGA
jgi:hypothetical protein